MVLNEILNRLKNVKGYGDKYTALCPVHDDKNSSLSISEDSGKVLLYCHAGCTAESIVSILGIKMKDLFKEEIEVPKQKLKLSKNIKPEVEYLYYYDLDGNVVHKTIRYGKQYNKPFAQARPNPNKQGAWIYNLKGIQTIIYNLPQVTEGIKAKKPIFIVEGEKDCDNLMKLGFIATTCPMGAGKWRKDYSNYFINSMVYIIPDNDETGNKHAVEVAKSLNNKAISIKILNLVDVYKELPQKGDITDFFTAVGKSKGLELLTGLMETSEEFKLDDTSLKIAEIDKDLNKLYEDTGYFVKGCKLWRTTSDGEVVIADFVPIPTVVITKNDGREEKIFFKIKGKTCTGEDLPETLISTEKFSGMQWVSTAWGYKANYPAGSQIKDYIRHAIASVGNKYSKQENIYTYTGWSKIKSNWVYLYNGGAIGGNNITVELEESLSNYTFRSSITDYSKALRTSYSFIDVAPRSITIPLLSMIYISPLNEFLKQVKCEPAYIIFLLGITGAMKSTLTALALSHFGDFNGKSLPSSFKDTANSIEKKGFFLKDSLTAIDDYHPSLQKSEMSRMERTAQEVTRSYGDRTARSRMNSDTSLKASYVPRGNLIITGEDIPNIGQSGIARHLILELKKGDIDKQLLSKLQEESDQLNIAMRGYIEWLLPQADELPCKLKEMFLKYRNKAQNDTQHARMPETVAWLQIGYEMFLKYLLHLNIIDNEFAEEEVNKSFELFINLAEEQSRKIENDKPTVKFINALRELLATGACHVKLLKDEINFGYEDVNLAGFIGYEDTEYYYLYGETTVKEVVKFYSQQGVNFPVTKTTLLKHLDIEKLIEVETNATRTYREKQKKIKSKKHRLIWLKKSSIEEKEVVNIKHMTI